MLRANAISIPFVAPVTGFLLQMDTPMDHLQNVSFSPSTLTIQCSGTYVVTFFGNFAYASGAAATLNFYVKANGRKLEETEVILEPEADQLTSFERSVIVFLAANTSLQAFMDANVAGTLNSPENGVHLTVRRIGA